MVSCWNRVAWHDWMISSIQINQNRFKPKRNTHWIFNHHDVKPMYHSMISSIAVYIPGSKVETDPLVDISYWFFTQSANWAVHSVTTLAYSYMFETAWCRLNWKLQHYFLAYRAQQNKQHGEINNYIYFQRWSLMTRQLEMETMMYPQMTTRRVNIFFIISIP